MGPQTEQDIALLTAKDTSAAFAALQRLEALSDESGELADYLPTFIEMCQDEKYVIRVRGFRLYCRQGQWDAAGLIDDTLSQRLVILQDAKPTAVRQALAALHYLAAAKPQLRPLIMTTITKMDTTRYNQETMVPLIEKDIAALQEKIRSYEGG